MEIGGEQNGWFIMTGRRTYEYDGQGTRMNPYLSQEKPSDSEFPHLPVGLLTIRGWMDLNDPGTVHVTDTKPAHPAVWHAMEKSQRGSLTAVDRFVVSTSTPDSEK